MGILSRFLGSHKYTKDSNILSNLTDMEGKIIASQTRLREATKLLDKGMVEYNRLYRARFNILTRIAELLIRCENMAQLRIARDLENILLDAGVSRFEPRVGEPVPRSKCRVYRMEFIGISPGLVAMVSAPGFIDTNGEVVLPADVFECIPPDKPETEIMIMNTTTGGALTESEDFTDILLLNP